MKLTALKRLSKPLVYRDFRLLWIGQSISSLGSSLQLVALPWLILQAHGSPLISRRPCWPWRFPRRCSPSLAA